MNCMHFVGMYHHLFWVCLGFDGNIQNSENSKEINQIIQYNKKVYSFWSFEALKLLLIFRYEKTLCGKVLDSIVLILSITFNITYNQKQTWCEISLFLHPESAIWQMFAIPLRLCISLSFSKNHTVRLNCCLGLNWWWYVYVEKMK
jgi:hypothetical protein